MRLITWMVLIFASSILLTSSSDNPFAGRKFYVNPSYQTELDSSIATSSGVVKNNLMAMREVASAYWLDVKAKIQGKSTDTLEGILMDAASKPNPELCVFIVYDLPNRDCNALASNGEICCKYNPDKTCDYTYTSECNEGLAEYKQSYIDPIAKVLAEYQDKVPIALVIEPDSLPNLATNLQNPRCGSAATKSAYMDGITYAVSTIHSSAPRVPMYVDAAHGGWLGWENNAEIFATTIAQMNIAPMIRGFSTNVANYQSIGIACPTDIDCRSNPKPTDPCCADPCELVSQYNRGNNELNYVQLVLLPKLQSKISGFNPKFIIDTGRNGVADMRDKCANWCNIRGAGVGHVPTASTPLPELLDAFFWLKTPGESDGCTEELPNGDHCKRYDAMCGSSDSIGTRSGEPRAPTAGGWFDYQIKQLAANSNMSYTAVM